MASAAEIADKYIARDGGLPKQEATPPAPPAPVAESRIPELDCFGISASDLPIPEAHKTHRYIVYGICEDDADDYVNSEGMCFVVDLETGRVNNGQGFREMNDVRDE